MKAVSAVGGILLLFACCIPFPLSAGGGQRAAELNGKYQAFLQCAREALQSSNMILPADPFRAVTTPAPLACEKVYLRVDVPLAERSDADVARMLRKNVFPVVERLHETLCDVLAHECCSGVMIFFHQNVPLAALAGGETGTEVTTVCLSKFDMQKLLSGKISVQDLLEEPFTVLQRNGREIEVD